MVSIEHIRGARLFKRKRSKFYQIEFTSADGQRVRKSAGTTDEEEARQFLIREYEQLVQLTFKEAVTAFFDLHVSQLAEGTRHQYLNSLRVMDPFFSPLTLEEITIEELKRFVVFRRQQVSNGSVKRDLMFLSSVFTFAQETLPNAPEVNPVKQLSKKRLRENQRERFLTYDEFLSLESACAKDWQKMVVRTFVHTGLRHQELCRLRLDWCNFVRREIRLPRESTKGSRPRIIPLFPEFADTLQTWAEQQSGPYMFSHGTPPVPYSSFQGFFKSACARAGLENVRIHDLRHTFASWWMQEGGDIYNLKDVLGHSTLQMVQRYAHLDTGAVHRAIAHFPRHTFGTLGEKPQEFPTHSSE